MRARVRKLTFRLRELGRRVEWAWTVEAGAKTGMIHVHLLEHGDYLPQRELERLWGARVDVRRLDDPRKGVDYALKEAKKAADYAVKSARANLELHLELNGGRGEHHSRGYLRGYRVDEVWRLLHPPDTEHDWIMVPMNEDLPAHLRTRVR